MDRVVSISLPLPRRIGLAARLFGALSFRRSCRRLADLDDHLLRDIGVTRSEALQERERPLWHAPDHWLR